MAMKVNVGDVVKVTDNPSYGYSGMYGKGDVGVVGGTNECADLFGVNLGEESGSPHWIWSVYEKLEPTEFTKADLKEGQVWVALEDRTYFTKGKTYEVGAPNEYNRGCPFIDNDGDENYNSMHYPPMHLLADVEAVDVPEEVEDNVVELDTGLTPFGELDSSKKAMLLLDHHEGKAIQMWEDLHWRDNSTPVFADHCIYRTKPQALIDVENEIAASEARTEELKVELERLAATL